MAFRSFVLQSIFRIALIVGAFAMGFAALDAHAQQAQPVPSDKGFPRAFHRRFLRWFAGYLQSARHHDSGAAQVPGTAELAAGSPTPNIRSAAH